MRKYIFLLLIITSLFACENQNALENEIAKVPVAVSVVRFEKEFAAATPETLAHLKEEFPMFFSPSIQDSVWIQRMEDPLQKEMAKEIEQQFPDETGLVDVLGPLFQHVKYYFPRFRVPTVVTLNSDVDYQNRIIVTDTMLLISLDNYLGADHRYYEGQLKFVSKNLRPSQIAPDVAAAYATKFIAPPNTNTFLEQMVYYGKQLYLNDIWLPAIDDAEKIGYSQGELQWALDNEAQVWRYLIEKELLFSTDPKLIPRFIAPAPFSKFYLELDNESPGMIGRYMGWQIVRSFMERNEVTPQQLMLYDAEALYRESNYKPKK